MHLVDALAPTLEAPMMPAEWFKRRLKALGLTQNDAAGAIRRDPSQITRALRGRRDWTATELRAIAALLRVTVAELVQRLGVTTTADDLAPLAGLIGADGAIAPAGADDVIDMAGLRGRAGFEHAEAYRIADNRGLPQYDVGDVLFFIPPRDGRLEHAAGHECVVTLRSGERLFRRVRPGSRAGVFHLMTRAGELSTDVELAAVVILDLIQPA